MVRIKSPFPRLAALALLVAMASACVSYSGALRQARSDVQNGNFDQAVTLLTDVAREHPNNPEVKSLLYRARLNAYFFHLLRARELANAQKKEEAMKEYDKAGQIFPENSKLKEEIAALSGPAAPEKKDSFHPTVVPPVQLAVKGGEKVSLTIRNQPVTNIFKSLGKTFGINFVFDKDFRDFLYSIEVVDGNFYDVLNQLCMISTTLYRVMDSKTLLIYPDQFAKKKAFDLRGIKTFYLNNIKAEDAKKTLMTVFREEQLLVQEEVSLNALIVRGDYNSLADVERFLDNIDKAKKEVEINIEILEISRTLASTLGPDFGNVAYSVSAGQVGGDGKVSSLMNLKSIGDTNFFVTLPSVALKVLEIDTNNKLLAKPNLRGVDGEDISFMVGDEIPIPETQFQGIAAGGISTVPMTTYKYRKVGVEIKIKPFIHNDNEVTLKMKLTVNFVAPGGSATFPVIGTREVENIIRLKEGETNIVGGLIQDQERGALSGIPIIQRIPILGRLFGADDRTRNQTDLIFSITPRIIRRPNLSGRNHTPIWNSAGQPRPEVGTPLETLEQPRNEEAPDAGNAPAARPPITEEQESTEGERSGGDSLTILPPQIRVPAASDVFFSIQLQGGNELSSLSFSGSVSSPRCEIMEVNTDALQDADTKIFKNFSGNRFNLGYTFTKPRRINGPPLAQLRMRFPEKGKYYVNLAAVNAADGKRNTINLNTTSAQVEVY